MKSLDLEVIKKNTVGTRLPYKLVDPSSIRFEGKVGDEDDIYIKVQGVDLLANAGVIDSLDEYFGISDRQKNNVEAALGRPAYRHFEITWGRQHPSQSLERRWRYLLIQIPRWWLMLSRLVIHSSIRSSSFLSPR